MVAVCAMVCGTDGFAEIELWARKRLDWLQRFMRLENGIASHDTFGRLFWLLDGKAVETSFRRWVASLIPSLNDGTVVAIDGKTSRRSGNNGVGALHMISALATELGLVLGQEATPEKSNEITAIPQLLEALMINGAIVTIDAMGTHSNIAQAIRDFLLTAKRPTGGMSVTISSTRSRRGMAVSRRAATLRSISWTDQSYRAAQSANSRRPRAAA